MAIVWILAAVALILLGMIIGPRHIYKYVTAYELKVPSKNVDDLLEEAELHPSDPRRVGPNPFV
jgi:hypothetical protein